jgi:CheY-like chemotaxis protein
MSCSKQGPVFSRLPTFIRLSNSNDSFVLPYLIFLDVNMPHMDGHETLKTKRKRQMNIRISHNGMKISAFSPNGRIDHQLPRTSIKLPDLRSFMKEFLFRYLRFSNF